MAPADICLEYVLFENPRTGYHQMSSDLRNVHYYAIQKDVLKQKFMILMLKMI